MAGKKSNNRLVVVESPTKARTIRAFLPQGYRVAASMGHVRDLPESAAEIPAAVKDRDWARLGVDVEAGFEPLYVVPSSKKKVVAELRKMLKEAEELVVATDEDREGESIGWHLVETLNPRVPVSRIVFHEITQRAISEALESPRDIDENLVRAQETRRILDRLVGYTVSPLLWKKIAPKLSAGRVQSVAVRLLVQRERERRAFHSGSYWDLVAHLAASGEDFDATLVTLGGKRLASGKDFDETTGRIPEGKDVVLLDEQEATSLRKRLDQEGWRVKDRDERASTRSPAPPFTTSTLQQEANRKLRLSARDTMRVAQRLYEEGWITYMRTDSVHLSGEAIGAARRRVEERYGKEYLSERPRQYTTKSKGAQEAHEAIRPAGTEMRLPDGTGLTGRERALYELIWKRTIATQMAEARQTHISLFIEAGDAVFRASGKRIDFPGFFRAYVEGSDDPDSAIEDREAALPPLKAGDGVDLRELEAVGHETQPPARYTEASLVKTLEAEGIGRPSTYASIIGTVIDRGYVERIKNQLVPTYIAFAVTELLEKHFPSLVDTGFTARMEEQLDEIARGEAEWLPYLEAFFRGEDGLESRVRKGEEDIDPREASTIRLEGLDLPVRIGRWGPFVERTEGDEVVTASLPADVSPGDLTAERVDEIVRAKVEGPTALGTDPETDNPVYLKDGPYGPYVQLGEGENGKKPKRASLPKGTDPTSVTLEEALAHLSLPRTLGEHPDTGKPVKAGVGRFGPFVVHEGDFRSLTKEDDVLTVTLDRALELLAQPKRGGRAAAKPLREVGPHPEDGAPITLHSGRYGPYVKHQKTNASLPKGVEPDDVTVEQAVELIAARRAKGGAGKGRSKKTTARKKTTKRSGGKKGSSK